MTWMYTFGNKVCHTPDFFAHNSCCNSEINYHKSHLYRMQCLIIKCIVISLYLPFLWNCTKITNICAMGWQANSLADPSWWCCRKAPTVLALLGNRLVADGYRAVGPRGSPTQTAKFTGPTWGPPVSCRPHMGPMLASWTLLSGYIDCKHHGLCLTSHSVPAILFMYTHICVCMWVYTYIFEN